MILSVKFRTVKCDWCGKSFEKYEKKIGERNFCCVDCVNKHRSKALNPEGYKRNWNAGHLTEYNKKHNKDRMNKKTRLKLRVARLGKGEGKTYEKTFGRHTHRIVAEEMLGRPLGKYEVVHHIDGDKRNNNRDNLMIFSSQADHLEWHRKYDSNFGGDPFHD